MVDICLSSIVEENQTTQTILELPIFLNKYLRVVNSKMINSQSCIQYNDLRYTCVINIVLMTSFLFCFTGTFTIKVPKASPGKHFEGLDMITKLLTPKGNTSAAQPLIEVLGKTEFKRDGCILCISLYFLARNFDL